MDAKNLAGSLKVAILIQSMGRDAAQEILDNLSDSERELVESHLSKMGRISPMIVEKVAEEFTRMALMCLSLILTLSCFSRRALRLLYSVFFNMNA